MSVNSRIMDVGVGRRSIERGDIDVFELIRRRSRWILFGAIFGILAGGVYAWFGSPSYLAEAEVMVIRKSPSLPVRPAAATTDVESDVTSNLLSTHVEILRSKRIVQDGLRRHGLENLASIEKNRYSFESPADYVIRKMTVIRGGEESVDQVANTLRVSLKHKTSAVDCQNILAAVIESYRDFVASTFQDVSSEAMRLMEQAKTGLDHDLKRAESDYVSFLQDAPLYWSGEVSASGDKRQSIPQRRLAQVEEKLADIRLRYIETRAKLEVIEKAMADAKSGSGNSDYALAMLDGAALQRLNFFADVVRGDPTRSEAFQVDQGLRQQEVRAEFDKQLSLLLESEANALKYGKNHWKAQELERQKAIVGEFLTKHTPQSTRELKDSVPPADILAAYVQMLQSDAADLKKRQDDFEALSRDDISAAKEVINFEVRGEMLRQELDRKRKLYEAVIDRLREMNLMKEYGGAVTELITPVEKGKLRWLGVIEVSPWFSMLLSVFAGGFVGSCMGAVSGVFRHLTDNTFGCDAEVEGALGLPVLGHADQQKMALSTQSKHAADLSKLKIAICSQPDSISAEAYRQIRNTLLLLRSRRDFKVVQISDVSDGEDHSILAANLAAALAEAGQKTLLVDCDLRNRAVSRLWGLAEQRGLSEYTRQEAGWEQLIQSVGVPGLSVLAAGRAKSGLTDSIFAANFQQLMSAVKSEFDFVILSSPSILGTSESLAITSYADLVLLSLRISRGKRWEALLACDNLIKFGVEFAAVVITGADDKSIFGYRDLKQSLRRLAGKRPAGAQAS